MPQKKKKKPGQQKSAGAVPRWLIEGLDQAEELSRKKRFVEARDLLYDLDRRAPGRQEILGDLANACIDANDMAGYLYALEHLVKIDPGDADVALGLTGAYLANMRPALALRAGRRFLERWPDHPHAAELRTTLNGLQAAMDKMIEEWPAKGKEGLELAATNEEMQVHLAEGRFEQSRKLAEKVLQRYPNFVAALNNLSLTLWASGSGSEAIAVAERVLENEPDNVHALSNLVHFLVLAGRGEEARNYAHRMLASTAKAADPWVKKLEALSFLGDNSRVLEVMAEAEAESQRVDKDPLLFHLAGVAALELGDEKRARRYWQRALKLDPNYALTQENLADLRKSVGEREGPWPFTFLSWIPPAVVQELTREAGQGSKASGQRLERALRRIVQKYPDVLTTIPHLLARGEPRGRELAMMVARVLKLPELLAALKDFGLSQRGPDGLRLEAARLASESGLLPSGPVRLWMKGEWQDVLLLNFEISGEPKEGFHSREVRDLMIAGAEALRNRDAVRAEELFKRADALDPDSPDILNNLAVAYELQERQSEADALMVEIHARHPDYLFARTSLARKAIVAGELDSARSLLDPILTSQRLHISELASLASAEIELALARKDRQSAEYWLQMWQAADPHHQMLAYYKERVEGPASLKDIARVWEKRR